MVNFITAIEFNFHKIDFIIEPAIANLTVHQSFAKEIDYLVEVAID